MVSGEAGGPVVSVLGAVEEANNISPGAVTPLLRPMVGTIARGNIPSINLATLRHAVFTSPFTQLPHLTSPHHSLCIPRETRDTTQDTQDTGEAGDTLAEWLFSDTLGFLVEFLNLLFDRNINLLRQK